MFRLTQEQKRIQYRMLPRYRSGFTLIEISIVLVIIGLIVGGILTGQNLIKAAELSATISQITKYNTAVNTFRLKYGNLPGDIPDPQASRFGFQARGSQPGEGDGNGILEGYSNSANFNCGYWESTGETITFWVDLSTTGLIDGGFNLGSTTANPPSTWSYTTPSLSAYFPQAKLGNGNYIYVWSGGWQATGWPCGTGDGNNYFGIAAISQLTTTGQINTANLTLTVMQAYNIDKKIDDGLPQSGRVMAVFASWNNPFPGGIAWAAGGGNNGASNTNAPTTAATPYASTNCYDNNNVAGAQQTYSLSQNANQQNCALSFRFQ
jgi:prepilin-type N-terminal cleavage/methylation domain-containing protein